MKYVVFNENEDTILAIGDVQRSKSKKSNCLKIDGDDMYWFEGKGVDKNFEGNFDVNMTAEIAEDIDNYICFYYRKARKNHKLSGTNDDMRNFCEKPFV